MFGYVHKMRRTPKPLLSVEADPITRGRHCDIRDRVAGKWTKCMNWQLREEETQLASKCKQMLRN